MAAINCKTYDTGEIVAEIRENRRYALASPSTVTGTPSLAMQSAAQMAVVYIYVDDVKISTPLTISGTTKTPIMINGASPSREDLLALSFEVTGIGSGEVLYTTDEPNGSPSSPFTTTDQRTAWATANLATLRSGVSTVWGPGAVEYVWKGPLATDWQGIRGPYLGSAENPYPASTTTAELVALAATGPDEVWIANPAVPRGKSKLVVNAARTLYVPPRGELIAGVYSSGASPYFSGSPGVLTLAEIWTGGVVPDYMIPDGLWMMSLGLITMSQASAPVGGAAFGVTLSSAAISDASMNATIQGAASVTPSVNGTQTVVVKQVIPFARVGATFMGTPGTSGGSSGQGRAIQIGAFAAGATCLRFGILASKVSDVGNIWNFEVVSQGMGA